MKYLGTFTVGDGRLLFIGIEDGMAIWESDNSTVDLHQDAIGIHQTVHSGTNRVSISVSKLELLGADKLETMLQIGTTMSIDDIAEALRLAGDLGSNGN